MKKSAIIRIITGFILLLLQFYYLFELGIMLDIYTTLEKAIFNSTGIIGAFMLFIEALEMKNKRSIILSISALILYLFFIFTHAGLFILVTLILFIFCFVKITRIKG